MRIFAAGFAALTMAGCATKPIPVYPDTKLTQAQTEEVHALLAKRRFTPGFTVAETVATKGNGATYFCMYVKSKNRNLLFRNDGTMIGHFDASGELKELKSYGLQVDWKGRSDCIRQGSPLSRNYSFFGEP